MITFFRFIGEETVSCSNFLPELTDAPTWIIDPIDGTTNFVHSFPHTCISIALAVDKELEIGIVYNPILEQLFTARRGHGAFLNEKPIKSSNVEGEQSLLFLTVSALSLFALQFLTVKIIMLSSLYRGTMAHIHFYIHVTFYILSNMTHVSNNLQQSVQNFKQFYFFFQNSKILYYAWRLRTRPWKIFATPSWEDWKLSSRWRTE